MHFARFTLIAGAVRWTLNDLQRPKRNWTWREARIRTLTTFAFVFLFISFLPNFPFSSSSLLFLLLLLRNQLPQHSTRCRPKQKIHSVETFTSPLGWADRRTPRRTSPQLRSHVFHVKCYNESSSIGEYWEVKFTHTLTHKRKKNYAGPPRGLSSSNSSYPPFGIMINNWRPCPQ